MFISVIRTQNTESVFFYVNETLLKNNPKETVIKCRMNAENVLALVLYYLSRFVYSTNLIFYG